MSRAAGAVHTPVPTPMPSAKGCDFFKRLFPVSKQSFDKNHLTTRQRAYIMKYVKQIPAADRRYARWMRDPGSDDGLLVFNAFAVLPDDSLGSHAAWTAENTNVGLDPIECRMFPLPVAMQNDLLRTWLALFARTQFS